MPITPAGRAKLLADFSDQRVDLTSEVISSVFYHSNNQTLDVEFTHGRTYSHPDVPPDVFLSLVQASSPGRYYNSNIRGKYT